eukprot:CAMPEP_0174719496 /NCGR_PEP_ID=MMETSP1094-20130205/31248_1 /TAXON_ID=156173 /ORGANISM="Chrysochromulina brevifilum, Strain UTEX LB 985" /LENGTH=54 /DNA_ID=CAMNT_0015919801 /DNA_START=504 /DNA_END=665 /DNA_ORIENTATION=+
MTSTTNRCEGDLTARPFYREAALDGTPCRHDTKRTPRLGARQAEGAGGACSEGA